MTLISDSEMAAIRQVAESGLITPVYLQTKVIDREAADGWSETWTEATTPVNGWLYEITSSGATLDRVAGAVGLAETLWLRLPAGTVIAAGDRARVGSSIFVIQHTNDESTYQPWLVCGVKIVVP
jgi:hypothetical protein